jgi:RNA polymerase sigma-70 factor, ECF subfamily
MRRERPDRTLPPTAVVHEALDRLAELDGRPPQVMTLRYFGGMTAAKVAPTPGVSVPTVEQDWRLARGWLAGQLRGRDR